jgi:hypothetical protein
MLAGYAARPLRHPWFTAFSGSVGLGESAMKSRARITAPYPRPHPFDRGGGRAPSGAGTPYVFFGGSLAFSSMADKRKLLIACDALSVLLTLTIPVSVAAGVFSLSLLYFIGFLLGTVRSRGACHGCSVIGTSS